MKALRESTINSLCHRQYYSPGGSVGIAIYDDRVEIENSGTFPVDMSIENLESEHRSEPPNPLIADVLYKRKVLENWGRGIGLMINECRRVGLPEPEFRNQITMQPAMQVTMQVQKLILSVEDQSLSVKEMMRSLSLNNRDYFRLEYLKPALEEGLMVQTYPEHPNHPQQNITLLKRGSP